MVNSFSFSIYALFIKRAIQQPTCIRSIVNVLNVTQKHYKTINHCTNHIDHVLNNNSQKAELKTCLEHKGELKRKEKPINNKRRGKKTRRNRTII